MTLPTGSETSDIDRERCANWDTMEVGDSGDFSLVNNMWSTTAPDQCIRTYDDGSYGWEWDRDTPSATSPNYPEVLVGTKPWGRDTGSTLFPIQRGDVDEFELALDVDQTPSDGQWNLAEEWWLTSREPGGDVSDSITHEIMVVLDWSDEHSHGGVLEERAFTDAYGNEYDYWASYDPGWDFRIFRIAGRDVPGTVDLSAVVDWLSANVDSVTDDLWLSGVEIGNEYWDDTTGDTRIDQFDVTVNGETERSGSMVSAQGGTVPRDGEAEISVEATDAEAVRIADLWTDWTVTDVTAPGATVQDRVRTAGEYLLQWDTVQASVSPTATVSLPARYVGGTYRFTVVSEGDGETFDTAATVEVE